MTLPKKNRPVKARETDVQRLTRAVIIESKLIQAGIAQLNLELAPISEYYARQNRLFDEQLKKIAKGPD